MPQFMVGHRGQPVNQVAVTWPLDPPYRITRRAERILAQLKHLLPTRASRAAGNHAVQ